MSGNTESMIVLRFAYQPSTANADIRTFRVYQIIEGSGAEFELYRFLHPMTGHPTGITTFHRKNMTTLIFETAGQIEWTSNANATIYFGVDEVPVKDLRRVKNATSQSRRFKVAGSEYKWKISENGVDMFCIDARDKGIANWSQEAKILRVSPRAEMILDRVIVSCFLNLWFKQLGRW